MAIETSTAALGTLDDDARMFGMSGAGAFRRFQFPLATAAARGLMSPTDKAKLDNTVRLINVLDYWSALHSDHTIAIDAAFAASIAAMTYDADREIPRQAAQPVVYFPFIAGGYTYSGTGFDGSSDATSLLMMTDPGCMVRIKIESDVYLWRSSNYVLSTHVEGFHFVGGKGLAHYTKTTENVAEYHRICRNAFDGYTECAFAQNSADMPFWIITDNKFHGADTEATIGFAIGGLLDGSVIARNQFEGNAYHAKIGPMESGNVTIEDNTFLRWPGSANRVADIWLLPSAVPFAVNSGYATNIIRNKFGNENLANDDVRILIAPEDSGSGTSRANRTHDTAWHTSGYFLSGLNIEGNRFSLTSGSAAPLIKSHIADVLNLNYGHNHIDGGEYTYLLENAGSVPTDDDAYVRRSNRALITPTQYMLRPFRAVSNAPTFVVDDPFALMPENALTPLAGINDDMGYALIGGGAGQYADISVFGSASKSAVADSYGGNQGAEITFAAAGTGSGAYVALTGIQANKKAWLELDFKQASSASVLLLSITILNFTTNKTAMRRVGIPIAAGWTSIRVPFVMPDSSAPTDWNAIVSADDWASGTKTKAVISNLRVYQSRAPVNADHIRTIGSGAWDGPHIIMGASHIWIDSTGDLRIKSSAPTGDTDGTVVGTQS